jgi:hypothetical protein
MTEQQAIELLTSYRNNWVDAEFFNLTDIDVARQIVHAAGYTWQYDNEHWTLVKTSKAQSI